MSTNTSASSLSDHAQRLVEAGQIEQALLLCEEGVLRDPQNGELWNFAAHLLTKLNRRHDALFYFHKAGSSFLKSEDLQQSIAAYKHALSIQPSDAKAHLALAAIYRTQGQISRAALSYELAAQALGSQGKERDALAAVQRIVEMSPDNVARRIRLAEQYVQAHMLADAVREFRAAEAFLLDGERVEEAARIAKRLHAIESHQRELAAPDPSVLIAEADSFLRLGLFQQAVDHLTAALTANPSLRALREPLAKLYVVQGRYSQAVAELRELIAHGPQRPDEIRLLRYVLRLDQHDPKVTQRLNDLLAAERDDSSGEIVASEGMVSVASVDRELRSALHHHRPQTDLATTAVIAEVDPREAGTPLSTLIAATAPSSQAMLPDASEAESRASAPPEDPTPPRPSATTRPGAAQIEAIAEEIALSSQSFRDKLSQIDRCVRDARLDEAQQHAQVLAACYPHNHTVRALLQELDQALQGQGSNGEAEGDADDAPLPVANEIAAAMRALTAPDTAPSSSTPPLSTLLSGAQQRRTTQEVDLSQVREEAPQPAATPAPPAQAAHAQPPPAPAPKRRRTALSGEEAATAFAKGMVFREHRDPERAIHAFEPLLRDRKLAARAALQIGLCYRDLGRVPDALAAFMRGVNLPTADDADLSELFYELAQTHAQSGDAKEAILFFQLALGQQSAYRDAAERIASLQESIRRSP